jgi:hypothetical protein
MATMTLDASELARQLAARRKPRAVVCPILWYAGDRGRAAELL